MNKNQESCSSWAVEWQASPARGRAPRSGPAPPTAASLSRGWLPTGGEATNVPQLCAKYEGCRSAATTGSLTVVVFDTAAAAKEYGSSTAGEDVEKSGGRR